MASATKEEIPVVADFMPNFWSFIKQYYRPEENDDYWENLITDGNVLAAQFPDELCKALIVAYIKHREVVYFEDQKKGGKT